MSRVLLWSTLCIALLAFRGNAATYQVVANAACGSSDPRTESYQIFAQTVAGETLRAVSVNLVAGPGSQLIVPLYQTVQGTAPVPPKLPSDTCSSYVCFGRISSGSDVTWVTPDFRITSSAISKAWFVSDRTSANAPAAGARVLIAQITVQSTTSGLCTTNPSFGGVINIVTNGARQNVFDNVCIGSGCSGPISQCTMATGYIVPVYSLPAPTVPSTAATPTVTYALYKTGTSSPILLDLNTNFQSSLPSIAVSATIGLASTSVNGAQTALTVQRLTDGSESFVSAANVAPARSLLVTVVQTVNPTSSNPTCTSSIIAGLVRDRQYSVNSWFSSVSNGAVTFSLTQQASVTINLSGVTSCATIDGLINAALQLQGITVSNFQHRLHVLPDGSSACGTVSASLGTAPGIGGFATISDCTRVDAAVAGLLRNAGLKSSDAFVNNVLYPLGDGSCALSRFPAGASGVHRRGLNAPQLNYWGALPASAVFRVPSGSSNVFLYPTYYTGTETVTRMISLGLNNYHLSYRAPSHPGADRQVNFAHASSVGNPGSVPSYTGVVLLHQLRSDNTTRLISTYTTPGSYAIANLLFINIVSTNNLYAHVNINQALPPQSVPSTQAPTTGTWNVDAAPGDVGMQLSSAAAVSTSVNTLDLGVSGTDTNPSSFVRFSVPVPWYAYVSEAILRLELSKDYISPTGTVYLELAVDEVDNSAALSGSMFTRSWSSVRLTTKITPTASSFAHDEVQLDVTQLVQRIVQRPGWKPSQFITIRIRNDPSAPFQTIGGSRSVYSGTSCGPLYGGGNYPCGPRISLKYEQRSTSSTRSSPTSQIGSSASNQPLSYVAAQSDGLFQTLSTSGTTISKQYVFPITGVTGGSLSFTASVTGQGVFQVAYLSGSTWVPLQQMSFTGGIDSTFVTKTQGIPAANLVGPNLIVTVTYTGTGSASLLVDWVSLALTIFNVNCISLPPVASAYPLCPSCVPSPQTCANVTIVSPQQGTGSSCATLVQCNSCTPPSSCPLYQGTVSISAFVSPDAQQQWLVTQTSSTTVVLMYSVPGLPNVQIGVAGKALTSSGPSNQPLGFWTLRGTPPGAQSCRVVRVSLTCPSGDPLATGVFFGSISCRNGLIPGPTRPAVATFTVYCT